MTPANRKKLRIGVLLSLVFVGLAGIWGYVPPLRDFEESTYDLRYRYFNRTHARPTEVTVIDIDEQSLALLKPAYGSWPWPRTVYKDVIEFSSIAETQGLFFDLMMYEPQLGTDNDKILAESIAAHGKTSFAMKFEEISGIELETGKRNPLPEGFAKKYLIPELESLRDFPSVKFFTDYGLPAQDYLDRISWLHSVNAPVDSDGIFRRLPLLLRYEGGWMPSLALAAVFARTNPGQRYPQDLRYQDSHLQFTAADGKAFSIPVDAKGNLLLHFYNIDRDNGREPLAPILESARALQSGEVDDPAKLKVNPLEFSQRLFMIGSSAATLGDLKSTPLSPTYPGVLLHAIAVSNILNADHLWRTPKALTFGFSLVLVVVTAFFILFAHNPFLRFGVPMGLYIAIVLLGILDFKLSNRGWDLGQPTLLFFGIFLLSLLYMIFVEGKEKRKIQDTLGKYLPPSVIQEMMDNGADLRAEVGKKMELSILFSDIRGFTSLSEKMPPEKVVSILNAYLGRMTDIVFESRGTLDKFIGDAIMSFWGAPISDPDHALHSTRCALQMISGLKKLKAEWKEKNFETGVDLQIGIGINTGVVIVGNIGSEKKLDYTVIGDNVNLASRLEGLTKQYKSQLIIGERTRELLGDRVVVRTADKVKVVGKATAVKIYEPLCEKTDPDFSKLSNLVNVYEQAWSSYERGAFQQALQGFSQILDQIQPEDGLSKVYKERCEFFIETPPAEGSWDGVYVAKSK
jgi:adenylate cyclase